MREILAPAGFALKLCKPQTVEPGRTYRAARHSLRIPCADGMLLYHTLSGELVLLAPGEEETARAELIRRRFLVQEDFDECRYADELRGLAAMLRPPVKGMKTFMILTTTDCNARCYYCYEHGRRREAMTEQTARDVGAYIAEACRGEKVKLSWFGGEPLMNITVIDVITGELRDRGVTFASRMTSNGYYLMPEVAARAKRDWNLEHVQITIDGTEAVYNRIKAYVDACDNPFQRVLNNIEAALDAGIRTFIRLNVDASNAADMLRAVDVLGEHFGGREDCEIMVELLQPYAGRITEFETPQAAADCYFALVERIARYGLARRRTLHRDFRANRCMADNDACALILTDGKLGKCDHYNEIETFGSIYSSEIDRAMLSTWKERWTAADKPECAVCPLYPRCILLKKCGWTKERCPDSLRMIRAENLRRQLVEEYRKWRDTT